MARVNLLTQSEYAKHRGCSAVAVHKAVKAGRISLIDGKIDPAVADIQWAANTRVRQSARSHGGYAATGDLLANGAAAGSASADVSTAPGGDKPVASPGAGDTGYTEARTRRERAEAEEAEMRTAKIRGTMVLREDVDRAMFEILREARDRLTSCARRIASEVASETVAETCESIIDREHRIVLELMVTAFREKVGAPPKATTP
jgi:hypothetical protein